MLFIEEGKIPHLFFAFFPYFRQTLETRSKFIWIKQTNKMKNASIAFLLLIFGCGNNNKVPIKNINKSMYAMIHLKTPDNTIEFFQNLKIQSEAYWKTIELNEDIYGF